MQHSWFGIWGDVPSHLVHLGVAYLLALPIGWDRENAERSAGIRTFPLVAVAACGLVLLGIEVLGETSPQQSRILEGLTVGIGFIGGGAILRQGNTVHGTATAASVWVVGMIGAAVGYGYYDIGFVLAAIAFGTLRLLSPVKQRIEAATEISQGSQQS